MGAQLRAYQNYANFDLGVALHETEQVNGEGGPRPTVKRCISVVPLDGQVNYYKNVDEVIQRLTAAGSKLVAKYNALAVKKSLEWRELICSQSWENRAGKRETTLFQQELSTYAFDLQRRREGLIRPMQLSDLKVCITARENRRLRPNFVDRAHHTHNSSFPAAVDLHQADHQR